MPYSRCKNNSPNQANGYCVLPYYIVLTFCSTSNLNYAGQSQILLVPYFLFLNLTIFYQD